MVRATRHCARVDAVRTDLDQRVVDNTELLGKAYGCITQYFRTREGQ